MQFIKQADFSKTIKSIKAATGKRVTRVHVALCSMLAHASEHGDHSALTDLLLAVSNAERNAIARWLPAFSPLEVRDGRVVKNRRPDANEYNVEAAVLVTHDAYKAPKADAPDFDLAALLKLLEKRADAKDADPAVAKYARQFASMVRESEELRAINAAKAQAEVNAWAGKQAA
jgi:hypothetical protein